MERIFFVLGSLLAGVGVALGAFGAHALQRRVEPARLETFETGVRYQMYHSLGLLAAALALARRPQSVLLSAGGWLFLAGMALFSGSLYLLVFTGKRGWGAITPLGGLAFIAGWIFLAIGMA